MMYKCTTPCIYYREIYDQNKKPSIKIICDFRDGEEIKQIPLKEKVNCQHFKTYVNIKWKL